MKFSWRTEWPHWLLLAVMFVLAATTWGSSPERIPVHWNIAGHVDRWGGKFEGLLAVPLLALGIYALLLVVPRLDPGRANYAAFAGPYATIRLGTLVVLAVIYALVVLWVRGVRVNMEVWVPLIVGGLFVVVGNVLGKVRPNWFVGVRTPWTLSSKVSWTRTHRAGGWLFVLMGVLFMVTAVLRSAWAVWVLLGASVVGVAGLIVYSYVQWRRDPEKTPPAGTRPAD